MDDAITTVDRGIALISSHNLLYLLLDVMMALESQEYWLSIGILLINNLSSVILFLFEGELVPLNQI